MTNVDRSTQPSSANAYGSPGGAHATDTPKEELASKGAGAIRDTRAGVENISELVVRNGWLAGTLKNEVLNPAELFRHRESIDYSHHIFVKRRAVVWT